MSFQYLEAPSTPADSQLMKTAITAKYRRLQNKSCAKNIVPKEFKNKQNFNLDI